MKITKFFIIVAGIIVFLGLMLGCAPGDRIIFRPDVYISGNFSPYNRPYNEPYYPLTIVTIVNGSPYELSIIRDGETVNGSLLPGQHFKLSISVDYRERRQVSVVAMAYKDKKLVGTALKPLYFHGNPYEQRSETWLIQRWDIRDP